MQLLHRDGTFHPFCPNIWKRQYIKPSNTIKNIDLNEQKGLMISRVMTAQLQSQAELKRKELPPKRKEMLVRPMRALILLSVTHNPFTNDNMKVLSIIQWKQLHSFFPSNLYWSVLVCTKSLTPMNVSKSSELAYLNQLRAQPLRAVPGLLDGTGSCLHAIMTRFW